METENNSVGCDDIPSFMNTTEYHEKRMSRLFEQHKQEETQRRTYYQLKREQKALQVRRIKNNRKIVAISVIVCGIMITAFATTLIANNAPVNDTKSTIEIEAEDVFGFIDYMHIEELRRAEASRTTIEESPKTEVNIDINDKTYDFAFESRLAAINSENHFQVGFSVNSYLVDKITQNRAHGSFLKYGEMYGIDPYLIMALAMQESSFQHSSCLPGGVNYNGAGVGITQLEHPNGREVTAFNHQTGNYDTMNITMENAVDMDTNIRMGVMNFQDCLKRSNGNILIALQTYNYGFPMMDMALEEYAAKNGTTINEVKNNYNDIGWLNIVEYMHSNPHEYNRSWPEPRYGDPNYIENVLRYFVGDTTFYYHDGELKVFDLTTLEVEIVDDKSKISK